jgi:hypothetical protein
MGLGDNLMATGFAKGAAKHGKRIAFGNGETILWDQYSEQIFQYNPNIARPGDEGASDLEWIPFYKGNRLYNKHDLAKERWIWNYDFKAVPGEMFFTEKELKFAKGFGNGFVLIEPHVPTYKGCAPNKTWSLNRYRNVVQMLKIKGHDVRQFSHAGDALPGVGAIHAPTFRHALAVLSQAALYIGPEGGLHHGAAAVGVPAVVIFGGFIPPQVTGYRHHINLTGGTDHFCGSLTPCKHCEEAMLAIKSKHVYDAAKVFLECSTSPHGSGEQSGQHTTLNGYSVGSNVI